LAKIFHFGVSDRPLLGSLNQAKRLRARSGAVLLCNPMGAEALLAHRLYRVLAEQLEQAGFTVLRFDYSGTGDSAGGDESTGVAAWLGDIRMAAEELARAAPGTRLVIAGVRLGATLASLATARLPLRARQLVLWDPIVNGAAHLSELAASHRSFMKAELTGSWEKLPVDAAGAPVEAMGMVLAPAFVEELRAIDLVREGPNADHITVISTQPYEGTEAFRQVLAERSGARWIELRDSENWNCDAALNAATVPTDIIREISASIQQVNP
jgi:pimeloyl-ACP methyl ester carboxylesterase